MKFKFKAAKEHVTVSIDHTPPVLIGRKAELRKAKLAAEEDNHIFIQGEFGIGKTAFAKAAAHNTSICYGYLSFEKSANETLGALIADARRQGLLPPNSRRTSWKRPGLLRKHRDKFAEAKATLLDLRDRDGLDVLIIDNIFSVTHPKLDFIRFLVQSGFRLILTLETKLPESELFRLRAICQPSTSFALKHLSMKESEDFLKYWQKKLKLDASPEIIEHIAQQQNGYPLFLHERVLELKEHKPLYHIAV